MTDKRSITVCIICKQKFPELHGMTPDGTEVFIHEKCALTTYQLEALLELQNKWKTLGQELH